MSSVLLGWIFMASFIERRFYLRLAGKRTKPSGALESSFAAASAQEHPHQHPTSAWQACLKRRHEANSGRPCVSRRVDRRDLIQWVGRADIHGT